MKKKLIWVGRIVICFVVLVGCFGILAYAEDDMETNTELMKATYKIEGVRGVGTATERMIGTVFLLGDPDPIPTNASRVKYVLVTAAHVLESMKGDKAILYLGREVDGVYKRQACVLSIRGGGKDLWVKHKSEDVAVMYVALPNDAAIPDLISTNWLADDDVFRDVGLHPGDQLMCLGYPYGVEANKEGFPVLRSGVIASYPIIPMKDVKRILFDFEVYKGNSGGPVYFVQSGRFYKGKISMNRFIVGLLSKQVETDPNISGEQKPLGIGVVVPAVFIKEALDDLRLR
jgi:hypothetical protein